MNQGRFKRLPAAAFLLFVSAASFAATDKAELEVLQSQATLQYHSKQHAQCIQTLSRLLSADPKNVAALELLALAQRESSGEAAAATTYEKLLLDGPTEKRPAYHF